MAPYMKILGVNLLYCTPRVLKLQFIYCLFSNFKRSYLSQFLSDLKNSWTRTPIFRGAEEILFSDEVSKMTP